MTDHTTDTMDQLRPARICAQLLQALDASDGRRARRKRNTTPDAVGQSIKRELLERAVADDPDPEEFDVWLLEQCQTAGAATGPVRAMARDVLDEWRGAVGIGDFRAWLAAGAPSDDRRPDEPRRPKGG